jgi:ribosomal-protein-alanine N-acetyltransferase
MLKLREVLDSDLLLITEYLNCSDICDWTTTIPFPYVHADSEEWFARVSNSDDRNPFAIEMDGSLVGIISYLKKPESELEVMYWVAKKFWGKGICTEALSLLLSLIKRRQAIRKIIAKVMVGNVGSEKVLLSNGFVYVRDGSIQKQGKPIQVHHFEHEVVA